MQLQSDARQTARPASFLIWHSQRALPYMAAAARRSPNGTPRVSFLIRHSGSAPLYPWRSATRIASYLIWQCAAWQCAAHLPVAPLQCPPGRVSSTHHIRKVSACGRQSVGLRWHLTLYGRCTAAPLATAPASLYGRCTAAPLAGAPAAAHATSEGPTSRRVKWGERLGQAVSLPLAADCRLITTRCKRAV